MPEKSLVAIAKAGKNETKNRIRFFLLPAQLYKFPLKYNKEEEKIGIFLKTFFLGGGIKKLIFFFTNFP